MAFGGVVIDHVGVTRDFPSLSMLTGLAGNALGWTRTDQDRLQRLQDRLVAAARLDRLEPSARLTDTQNVRLEKNDRGWTTRGAPEGRAGDSYGAPHRRLRDYHQDVLVTVILGLDHVHEEPGLDALEEAFERPKRPLFIGRKTCLPTGPLLRSPVRVEAPTAFDALTRIPARSGCSGPWRAFWPAGQGPVSGLAVTAVHELSDLRNWRSGLHGGSRTVVEGRITLESEAA